MTPTRFTADELNAAINTAARGMTTATTSPELRARVMARIDIAQPRWGWRLAIAGGAVGVVAIAAALTWRVQPIAVPSLVAPAVVATAADAETVTVWVAPPSYVTAVFGTGFADSATAVVPTASELEWQTRAVQRLPIPDALAIERIVQTDISIAAITIEPLVVAPLSANGAGSQ